MKSAFRLLLTAGLIVAIAAPAASAQAPAQPPATQPPPAKPDPKPLPPPKKVERLPVLTRKASTFASKEPENTAKLIRSWMADPER